jgi:hypothetical protein
MSSVPEVASATRGQGEPKEGSRLAPTPGRFAAMAGGHWPPKPGFGSRGGRLAGMASPGRCGESEDLGGETKPMEGSNVASLATAERHNGLVSGAKPWSWLLRVLSTGSPVTGLRFRGGTLRIARQLRPSGRSPLPPSGGSGRRFAETCEGLATFAWNLTVRRPRRFGTRSERRCCTNHPRLRPTVARAR